MWGLLSEYLRIGVVGKGVSPIVSPIDRNLFMNTAKSDEKNCYTQAKKEQKTTKSWQEECDVDMMKACQVREEI